MASPGRLDSQRTKIQKEIPNSEEKMKKEKCGPNEKHKKIFSKTQKTKVEIKLKKFLKKFLFAQFWRSATTPVFGASHMKHDEVHIKRRFPYRLWGAVAIAQTESELFLLEKV